jgi:hypothetical protein
MRNSVLTVLMLLLAACANGSQSNSKTGGSSMLERASSLTFEEAKDYASELAEERVKAICRERRGISAQAECVRDELFRGFDTTGEAKRNCNADAPLKEVMRCAVLGSFGYEIALAAKLPVAAHYNWQDPSTALKDTVSALGKAQMDTCMERSISLIEQCFVDGIGSAFSLSEQQIAACHDKTDSRNSIDCLIRVFLVQRFESAVARMGPGDGERV